MENSVTSFNVRG